jgi:hypothetical protein
VALAVSNINAMSAGVGLMRTGRAVMTAALSRRARRYVQQPISVVH